MREEPLFFSLRSYSNTVPGKASDTASAHAMQIGAFRLQGYGLGQRFSIEWGNGLGKHALQRRDDHQNSYQSGRVDRGISSTGVCSAFSLFSPLDVLCPALIFNGLPGHKIEPRLGETRRRRKARSAFAALRISVFAPSRVDLAPVRFTSMMSMIIDYSSAAVADAPGRCQLAQ